MDFGDCGVRTFFNMLSIDLTVAIEILAIVISDRCTG